MRHWQLLTLAMFLPVLPALQVGTPVAAAGPNILLLGADSEQGSVRRDSRVFEGVVDELSAALQNSGFSVYDEAATTYAIYGQDHTRRSNAELIEIARSVLRPPVDLVISFSIHSKTEPLTYTTRIGSQVTARLVNVMTGQHLGNFQVVSARSMRVPADCQRGCLAEVVERHTRRLARELGRQLKERLTSLMTAKSAPDGSPGEPYSGMPDAYSLVFDGFSAQEVFEIEEYLVVFSGYRHHRPVSSALQRHEYWYETGIARGRLNRNLNKMLDYLNMPGQVDLSGNVFTVTKTATVESKEGGWDDW